MRKFGILLILAAVVFLGIPATNAQAIIVIDEITDSYTSGGYTIEGNDIGQGIGTHFKIIKANVKPAGSTKDGGTGDHPSLDRTLAQVQTSLAGFGIVSTEIFAFGVDINENASDLCTSAGSNTECIAITQLTLTIDDGTDSWVFNLGNDDVVEIYEINQGSNTAEAVFIVDLGQDFMALIPSNDPGSFELEVVMSKLTAGNEEYFTQREFFGDNTGNDCELTGTCPSTIPEPMSLLLMGSGLAAFAGIRRKRS